MSCTPSTPSSRSHPLPPTEGLDPHTIELLEYLHNVIITKVLPVAPLCRNIVPFFDRAQNPGGIINSAVVIRECRPLLTFKNSLFRRCSVGDGSACAAAGRLLFEPFRHLLDHGNDFCAMVNVLAADSHGRHIDAG